MLRIDLSKIHSYILVLKLLLLKELLPFLEHLMLISQLYCLLSYCRLPLLHFDISFKDVILLHV